MSSMGGGSRPSRGGLTECSRCRGIFSTLDLLDVRGQPVCRLCGARAGVEEAGAGPSASSARPAPPAATSATGVRPAPLTSSRFPGAAAPAASGPPSAGPAVPPPVPFAAPAPTAAGPRLEAPVAAGSKVFQTPRFQPGNAAAAFAAQNAAQPGGSAVVTGTPKPPTLSNARMISGGSVASNQEQAFQEYSSLRQRIDAGEDTIETRKRAAELASRLNLGYEAVEHYERWAALDPNDVRVAMLLENVRRSVGLLPDGKAAPPPPEPSGRALTESAPFWEEIGDVVAWPFRGNGPAVLLVGGVCFGLAQVVGAFNIYGWIVSIGLWGYICSYLFSVINVSAAGRKSPPELPESADLLESYVFPFFAFLACGVVSYAPFLVGLYAWGKGWLPDVVAPILSLGLFALGAFVFPMTLMVRGMFQSLGEAARPAMVLGSIGRILPDYIACYVALAVLWTLCAVAHGVMWFGCFLTLGAPTPDAVLEFDGMRVLSWLVYTVVSWPAFLYSWMLQGHLLGRLYRQGLQRLAWFVKPTDATRRARKMSAVLWVCAGGAAVLVCGVAWAGSKLIDLRSGGLAAGSLLEKCPLKDGSRLTYFWDHTDGGAGLTEYTFHTAPGGGLRVKATTRFAGRANEPMTEEVGTFDPATGLWTEAMRLGNDGGTIEGAPGEHVPFYGPKRSAVGSTFVDDWVVRESVRWQGAWTSWKLIHPRTTAEFYFDSNTGLLVGRRMPGIGWTSTSWLVGAQNVPGARPGPAPPYDFSGASDGADPYGSREGTEPWRGSPMGPPPERSTPYVPDDDE